MKKHLKLFFSLWAGLLVVNQIFIFNGCFTPYCIVAALPHTGIIAFFLARLLIREEKDTEKTEKKQPETRKKFNPIENDDPLKKKGDQYEKLIGDKFEKKGDIVIYNGFIQEYKDEGVDLIAVSPNDKNINFIQCKNWTRKSMELSDIKEIYEKLDKFDFGCCIEKIKNSIIFDHMQLNDIDKSFFTNQLSQIRNNHGIYTIRKTLYISSEKVVNLEVGEYLKMMKKNIFRYKDMKIVLVRMVPKI
ncbi:restriction endonuclease [Patescibacteria group bacterium]|nr:restriction endonuclease [Patescibacteria group bacterium]